MNNNIITHLLSYKTEDLGDKDMCLRQYMRIDIRKDAFSIKGEKDMLTQVMQLIRIQDP